ncbi:MAG: ABC transporter substrate-binding protein [Desulfomonile tiedjei]|nr:ABC transporter substrate-binding protein [Desulfomonile tiedjei]
MNSNIVMKAILITLGLLVVFGSSSFAQGPVKIGFAHVFSGPMATFGDVARQGAQIAANEINGAGGILGRKVELVYGDTAAKPDVGKPEIERLINSEGVAIVIGIVSSAVAKAVTPAMNDLKCPLIITHAMLDEVTGSLCNPWTFRMTWNMDQCYKSSAIIAKNSGAKKWTTVGPDYGFGQDSWKYFMRYGNNLGGMSFEQGIFTPLGTKDWAPVIEQLRTKSNADGIMLSLWGNDLKDFLRQAHRDGLLEGKTTVCAVGGSVEIFTALGVLDMPKDVWFGSPYWYEAYNNASNANFIKSYGALSAAEIPPSYAAYNSYAAIMMFKAAVEKAGSFDRADVAATLSGLTVADLPVGSTTFRGEDHQAIFDVAFGKTSAHVSKMYKRIRSLDSIKLFPGKEVTPPASEGPCKMPALAE